MCYFQGDLWFIGSAGPTVWPGQAFDSAISRLPISSIARFLKAIQESYRFPRHPLRLWEGS
jgi:hypothetical protein